MKVGKDENVRRDTVVLWLRCHTLLTVTSLLSDSKRLLWRVTQTDSVTLCVESLRGFRTHPIALRHSKPIDDYV